MVHLNITFPEDLKRQLDQEIKREKTKRSTFIQRAVRFYLGVKSKKEKDALMKEECLVFADESKRIMEDFKYVDAESLKYLDD
jgi:metal-responsive CopG/Arc/MetJ family transcriptional regulator